MGWGKTRPSSQFQNSYLDLAVYLVMTCSVFVLTIQIERRQCCLIQVTDPGDYSLAQLKGFSVSPGFAVQVQIRPNLFGITEQALQKFDYLERNCVEPSVDKELNHLYGTFGNYTLSNCLVSATWTNIKKR